MTAHADLVASLRAALKTAMRERDAVALSTCREALAAIANAEAVSVDVMPRAGAIEGAAVGVGAADATRRELTSAEIRAVIEAEIAERRSAAGAVEPHDAERAAGLRAGADLLVGLLR